ncbi:MAG: gamma-glutamyltransferase, partial [Desulfurococcales archaeon]|nr:gamma-glutamyltransferase [Desulfurococcales archaeon]
MPAAFSTRGAVASEHPLASYIGARILEKGGNAVDASVAVAMALSVLLPHLGGLGGDFFALVRTSGGRVAFVDGSGPAPRRLSIEYLRGKGYASMPAHGPHTVTVPGFVDALRVMWSSLGSMEWALLVEPARELASKGFPASRSLARASQNLRRSQGDRATTAPSILGLLPSSEGDLVRMPGLSRALSEVAEDPRSFYEGDIAGSIVETLEGYGGVLDLEDMRSYQARVSSPISLEALGCRFYEMPPPTQGISTLHMIHSLDSLGAPGNP